MAVPKRGGYGGIVFIVREVARGHYRYGFGEAVFASDYGWLLKLRIMLGGGC